MTPFRSRTANPTSLPTQSDYAHLNTVQMVDGDIIASFRGCNSVLRIDPDDASSHKVVWRLGLTNLSDEQWDALGKGPAPLDIIGDAEGQFCGQHGTSLLPNGHLILFDNGVLCMARSVARHPAAGETGRQVQPRGGVRPRCRQR